MYSFTTVKLHFKKLVAAGNFCCEYCNPKKNPEIPTIVAGEDFYIIEEGYRVYDKLSSNESGSFVAYVPRKLRRGYCGKDEEFKEKLNHRKVCAKCLNRLMVFLRGFGPRAIKYDVIYKYEHRFTMTYIYGSMKSYICPCCGKSIPIGSSYVREGHYGTYCLDCVEMLQVFIGKEYSYRE